MSHSSESAFGIDLGMTRSCIAYITRSGDPEVIANTVGELTTPSVVRFEDESHIVVGEEAEYSTESHVEDTVSGVTRYMGTDLSWVFFGESYTPARISALLLTHLVEYAKATTGLETNKVVIAVPVYFGHAEVEATRQAASLAKLEVVDIIRKPVAAVLSAGNPAGVPCVLVVYDLGGRTFECTIVGVTQDHVEVITADGDRNLGGVEWSYALFELVATKLRRQATLIEDRTDDESFRQQLLKEVEAAKKILTRHKTASVRVVLEGRVETVHVTRAEFEQATADLVQQTIDIVERAIAIAARNRPDLELHEILLVGGSSRMPMIETALSKRRGWTARGADFDVAAAKGAAIVGYSLANERNVASPGPDLIEFFSSVGYDTISNLVWLSLGLGAQKALSLARTRTSRLQVTQDIAIAAAIRVACEYDPSMELGGLIPLKAAHFPPRKWEISLCAPDRELVVLLSVKSGRVKGSVTSDTRTLPLTPKGNS